MFEYFRHLVRASYSGAHAAFQTWTVKVSRCKADWTRPHPTMSTDAQLYEEAFNITTLVPQAYDRVSRIIADSPDNSTKVTLDINNELYPLSPGENFTLLLAQTLNLDGTIEDVSKKGWRPNKAGANEHTLADLWDYVCYGKVYRHEDPGEGANM